MLRRLLTVGFKLGFVVGAVALVVKALQRRDDARRRPPPSPPWPPLEVDGEQQRTPAAAPATEEFSLSATKTEVGRAARATGHEASELQQGLSAATVPAVDSDDAAAAWVEPVDGACPASHPVKAKLRSRVFHLPGMANYERTNADRCYRDGAAAEGDGFRQAKH